MAVLNVTPKYEKTILGIPTSNQEIRDLLKAWFIITVAFTILLADFAWNYQLLQTFILAAITVGTGFLLHELAHKFVAQHYGFWAEFRADQFMLMLALIFSFFGFIFAAPGAVLIHGYNMTKSESGKISAAGPLVNYLLALIFLGLMFSASPFIALVASYGFMINSWLGLFNMIPLGMFDGVKILRWNKVVYGIMVAVGIVFLVVYQIMY